AGGGGAGWGERVGERVTTALGEVTFSCLSGKLASALILFCTSAATCWSVRPLRRVQPAAISPSETIPTQKYLLINHYSCTWWRVLYLDAELLELTALPT